MILSLTLILTPRSLNPKSYNAPPEKKKKKKKKNEIIFSIIIIIIMIIMIIIMGLKGLLRNL